MAGVIEKIRNWIGGVRSIENPAVPMSQAVEVLLDAFGAGEDPSGQSVSPRTAQKMSAVYACLRLIAETAGSLPIGVYRETAKGQREPADGHPLNALLENPSEAMTGQVCREQLFKAHLLWGNAYAEIRRSGANGELAEIWPLDPSTTNPVLDARTRRILFRTTDDFGNRRILFPEEILHVPLLPDPGEIGGIAPPASARTAIGIGLAAEAHDAKFYGQGGLGPLKVELPSRWDDESFNKFKKQVADARKSGSGILIFESGTKADQLKPEIDGAQIRRFQVLELARFYGVPPHMIGEAEKGAPKSSVEEQEREFAKHTLRPLLLRFEAEYNRKLFDAADRGRYVVAHDLSSLLQADTRTMWQAFWIGRQAGVWSANDIRRKLGEPSLGPRGDQYLTPVNLDIMPRALEQAFDGQLRRALAELEAAERRNLLEATDGDDPSGLADRAERFYRVDLRALIARTIRESGERFARDLLRPLGLLGDEHGFGEWADRVAGRHCDRALGSLRADPVAWIAGGHLEYDPAEALAALMGGNGHARDPES